MCGLAGYFLYGHQPEAGTATMLEMLALQRHRGPDDQGILAVRTGEGRIEDPGCRGARALEQPADLLLGFNRLNILDLSANGHQPMRSREGQVILLMNGEVYNAFDFREELQAKGYRFRSGTDTEAVLYLYQEYGMAGMLRRLNGMFALAVYDARTRELHLARDRFGIKPLYLLHEPGRWAFSSELKSFKALPGFRFALEEQHLDEFLLFRNLIHRTLFKGIIQPTPGTWVTLDPGGQCREQGYYHLTDDQGEAIPLEEAQIRLDRALQQAVQRQMISDVKLGCQLSGGVDSSLVSAYAAAQLPPGQLETVSITFREAGFSEEPYIRQAAGRLGLQAHTYALEGDYYLDQVDAATWHFEQPLNHPNTIGIKLLSQEARRHVTVLLSGEGADEALAGYGRFLDLRQNPWFSRLFLGLLRQNRSEPLAFLRWYADPLRRRILASAFGSPALCRRVRPGFDLERALSARMALAAGLDLNSLHGLRQYELQTYLPDLLMRQDKMSMAHSIENRVPFLDHDLVSLALRLPKDSLLARRQGRWETKAALKAICAARFDAAFAYRPKMGFGIPLRKFLAHPRFRQHWQEQVVPYFAQTGLLDTRALAKAAQEPQQARPDELDALWLLSGFESWARQYLQT